MDFCYNLYAMFCGVQYTAHIHTSKQTNQSNTTHIYVYYLLNYALKQHKNTFYAIVSLFRYIVCVLKDSSNLLKEESANEQKRRESMRHKLTFRKESHSFYASLRHSFE